MKKFVATWFGVGVFDNAWFEQRMEIFKNITYPSMKEINDKDFFWMFYIDDSMPLKYKRELTKMMLEIEGIRVNIVEVKFYFEVKEHIKKFVNEYTEHEEWVVLGRIDADDSIETGFFDNVFDYKKERRIISYSKLWLYNLHNNEVSPIKRDFRALNTFIVTNNRKDCIYNARHDQLDTWAKNNGMKVEIIDSEYPYFLRTLFDDQDSDAISYFTKKHKFVHANESGIDFEKNYKVNFNNILAMDEVLKIKTNLKWDYSNKYVRYGGDINRFYNQAKKDFINQKKGAKIKEGNIYTFIRLKNKFKK